MVPIARRRERLALVGHSILQLACRQENARLVAHNEILRKEIARGIMWKGPITGKQFSAAPFSRSIREYLYCSVKSSSVCAGGAINNKPSSHSRPHRARGWTVS